MEEQYAPSVENYQLEIQRLKKIISYLESELKSVTDNRDYHKNAKELALRLLRDCRTENVALKEQLASGDMR